MVVFGLKVLTKMHKPVFVSQTGANHKRHCVGVVQEVCLCAVHGPVYERSNAWPKIKSDIFCWVVGQFR